MRLHYKFPTQTYPGHKNRLICGRDHKKQQVGHKNVSFCGRLKCFAMKSWNKHQLCIH